jgi:uncharacterized protein with HEPN domain
MSDNRLPDYPDHMQPAALDACGFLEGMTKQDFPEVKRSKQGVIMNLIIIGEAATKVMDSYPSSLRSIHKYRGEACEGCAIMSVTAILRLTLMWLGIPL